jgi:hypothetical protein
MTPELLVEKYSAAQENPDLMRGFKRSLTVYCNKKSEETGTPPFRFKAAIKMLLTKAGHDSSSL